MKDAAQRLGVVLFVVVLAVALVGCGATPTPTATPRPPTATPVPATAPPTATKAPVAALPAGNATAAERELVGMALLGMSKAQSFGMNVTIEGPSTFMPFAGDLTLEVVQTPLRSVHLVMGAQLEMIVIGPDAYIKMGDAWQKTPMQPAQLEQIQKALDFSSSIKPEELAVTPISRVGSERVNGVDCDVFDVTVGTPPLAIRVWVAKADKLPMKQTVKDATSTITITFYDWNKIKIAPPKL